MPYISTTVQLPMPTTDDTIIADTDTCSDGAILIVDTLHPKPYDRTIRETIERMGAIIIELGIRPSTALCS
jgi:hypothetical protein